MKLPVEPPEKTKSPSFSLLPDEITVNYLARIPRAYYPRLSAVSKSFKSILSSNELYAERSHLGTTEHCLYVSIWDTEPDILQWFRLWINPSPDSSMTSRQLLVLFPVSALNESSKTVSVVVVGCEVYAIGGDIDGSPLSTVRILDCCSHTWRDAPSMKVARRFASSCFYDGKIYVLGGYKERVDSWYKELEEDETWAEVFDVKTQTWEPLPEPGSQIRKCYISKSVEMEGNIIFGNQMNVYSYDPKQGKWEHCGKPSETFLLSECVIENVIYSRNSSEYDYCSRISWYDSKVGDWKKVEGLDSLDQKHFFGREADIGMSTLVNCGGKLLLVWKERMIHSKKIWCAEIKVEKCDDGEVWGNVEWVNVVHTGARTCTFLYCLSVSV